MYTEQLYDVVIINDSKVTIRKHDNPIDNGHVTGVFLTRREALINARKLSRQHGLELVS